MELKLAGGRLRVHLLLLPICALLIHKSGWAPFLSFTAALLLHETAHLLTASALGVRVISMELLPFGCAAHLGSFAFVSKGKESLVAAAGPIGNFFAAMICELLSRETLFFRANLVLGAMNLLPSLPLDGGRIAAVMLSAFLPRRTALVTASILGLLAGAGIVALGIAAGEWMSCFVMGGFMLYSSAKSLRPQELDSLATSAAKAFSKRAIMDVKSIACSGEQRMGEVFLTLDRRKYNLIYLLDEQMRVRGVIDEGTLVQRMLQEGSAAKLKKESEQTIACSDP